MASAFDTAELFQQIRKFPVSPRLLSSSWGLTQGVVAQGGRAVEGAQFQRYIALEGDASPRALAFAEAYLRRFHRPADFAAAMAYEATTLAVAALRRDATRAGVRRAVLEAGAFQGLQDMLRIDSSGDVDRPCRFVTIRGGRVEPLAEP